MIKKRYTDCDARLRDAISRAQFSNPETRRQCSHFVDYLCIHRNLFFHTYVLLATCCKGRQLHLLVDNVNIWKEWGSVQQLTHHALIREKLLKICADYPCHDHKVLVAQQFVIGDDDEDLLSHLFYCGRKPELYEPSIKPTVRGHDHVLTESEQIIDVAEGTFDNGLVSPFFKNGSIKNHMNMYKPKDWPGLARRWGGDLASALDYLHSHEPPIIHGDLKGDNVLVDDTSHASLGDFGQSHSSDSGKNLDSTRVGLATYGPVHWMAPEIMVGDERAKSSDKSDIYSFGCVLYEVLSGKIPFEGFSFGHVVKNVKNGDRPKRPEFISRDEPLWDVAKSCWRKMPDERASATVLVSLLR